MLLPRREVCGRRQWNLKTANIRVASPPRNVSVARRQVVFSSAGDDEPGSGLTSFQGYAESAGDDAGVWVNTVSPDR